jgi:hypothetical protein
MTAGVMLYPSTEIVEADLAAQLLTSAEGEVFYLPDIDYRYRLNCKATSCYIYIYIYIRE